MQEGIQVILHYKALSSTHKMLFEILVHNLILKDRENISLHSINLFECLTLDTGAMKNGIGAITYTQLMESSTSHLLS